MNINQRLTLITCYPVGLGGAIYHVINGIYYALATGRKPLVFWDRYRCLYVDRTTEQPARHNYFGDFFEPVSNARMETLTEHSLTFFPPFWTVDKILDTSAIAFRYAVKDNPECLQGLPSREESAADVVVFSARLSIYDLIQHYPPPPDYHGLPPAEIIRRIAHEYLRLKPELATLLQHTHAAMIGTSPYLAVHIRATDKATETPVPNTAAFIQKIRQALRAHPGHKIFLATDSAAALQQVKKAFPNQVVCHEVERSASSSPLHVPSGNGRTRAVDFLKDCYSAIRGSLFIGTPQASLICVMQDVVGESLPEDKIMLVQPTRWNVLDHRRIVLLGKCRQSAGRWARRVIPTRWVAILKRHQAKA